MEKSPGNARGFMNFGLTRVAEEPAEAVGYFLHAQALSPHDPVIGINLAHGYNALSRTADAEAQFRRAIADGRSYAPAYSAYAEWLQYQQRIPEAYDMGMKAIRLDSYDPGGRRTVMEVMAQRHQWHELKRMANETLALNPDSVDGQRLLLVAQTGLDDIEQAEKLAAQEPSVDRYLKLSVRYYEDQRYDDSIRAAREALRINPTLGEAYANIASASHASGKVDEAIAALREEIRLNPNLPSAQKNLDYELARKASSRN
jgi:tetratricopeptide (TPR) repeat protein